MVLGVCPRYDVLVHPEDSTHHGIVQRFNFNYKQHSLEPLREILLAHDEIIPGFADGGAHTKLQCEAVCVCVHDAGHARDSKR